MADDPEGWTHSVPGEVVQAQGFPVPLCQNCKRYGMVYCLVYIMVYYLGSLSDEIGLVQTKKWIIDRMKENAKSYDHTMKWRVSGALMRVFDGDLGIDSIPSIPGISLKYR